MNRYFYLILFFVLLTPLTARAQCVNPPAEMGVIIFNKDHKVMQYCNGDEWIGIWGGGGGSGGGQRVSGEVVAFDLDACPDGWSPYNPSSGRFIRGRCISGQPCNDPDGTRTSGNVQADEFKSHNHAFIGGAIQGVASFNPSTNRGGSNPVGYSTGTDVRGGDETRPKNVALLYCRKN